VQSEFGKSTETGPGGHVEGRQLSIPPNAEFKIAAQITAKTVKELAGAFMENYTANQLAETRNLEVALH
jgi:hypothetical protein